MRDDERVKRARDRANEYVAERIREDEEKRRKTDTAEADTANEGVEQASNQPTANDDATQGEIQPSRKREREESEQGPESEDEERNLKRESADGQREADIRRKLLPERGTRREAEEEPNDNSGASRVRLEIVEEDDLHETEWMWDGDQEFDSISGEVLDKRLVQAREMEEMSRFKEMGVYEYVTPEEAHRDPEGVIIDVRWVIVNKGTASEPNVRCRLVGREFATKGNRDDLFAGTPPLVTIRVLLSLLAKRREYEDDISGMVIDVKGAFLYGKKKRNV